MISKEPHRNEQKSLFHMSKIQMINYLPIKCSFFLLVCSMFFQVIRIFFFFSSQIKKSFVILINCFSWCCWKQSGQILEMHFVLQWSVTCFIWNHWLLITHFSTWKGVRLFCSISDFCSISKSSALLLYTEQAAVPKLNQKNLAAVFCFPKS